MADVLAEVAAGAARSPELVALARRARRIVVTGNGAAYYAALALWTAALQAPQGPEVVALPAGVRLPPRPQSHRAATRIASTPRSVR